MPLMQKKSGKGNEETGKEDITNQVALTYRMYKRSKKGGLLHWNPKCRYWPTKNYVKVGAEEADMPEYILCSMCRRKAENEMRAMAKKI